MIYSLWAALFLMRGRQRSIAYEVSTWIPNTNTWMLSALDISQSNIINTILKQPERKKPKLRPDYELSLFRNQLNALRPRQIGRDFRRHFQMHFIQWKSLILIKMSLNLVPKGLIDNKWSLVQVMVWHRTDHKPLAELLVTQFGDAYMYHQAPVSETFRKIFIQPLTMHTRKMALYQKGCSATPVPNMTFFTMLFIGMTTNILYQ